MEVRLVQGFVPPPPTSLALLHSRNPGTIIDIDDYQNGNGDRVLRRAF